MLSAIVRPSVQPLDYRAYSAEALLSLYLVRRLFYRGAMASSTLILWRLFPKQVGKRIEESSAFRCLQRYAGFRWVLSEVLDATMYAGFGYIAFKHWASSEVREAFPSWVHALMFNDSMLQSYYLVPATSWFILPKEEYRRIVASPKFNIQWLGMEFSYICRLRLLELFGIVANTITKENTLPLVPAVAKWSVETALRFGGAWAFAKLGSFIPANRHPILTTTVTSLVGMATVAYVSSEATARLLSLMLANEEASRDAHEARINEDAEYRDTIAQQIAAHANDHQRQQQQGDDAAAAATASPTVGAVDDDDDDDFLLERMETTQVEEVMNLARAVASSSTTHHAARLKAMKTFHDLRVYVDAASRDTVNRGVASALDQISRRISFSSSTGVESSVRGLEDTAVGDDGQQHTTCCPVCIDEYADGDEVVEMSCGHLFHDPCIRSWLEGHKQCPMCRHDVRARANTETFELAYSTDEVLRAKLKRWMSATLPGDLATGRWGDVSNFARTHGSAVPESMLKAIDPDTSIAAPATPGFNWIVDLVFQFGVGMVDIAPLQMEGF